jgi:hypothetical protein
MPNEDVVVEITPIQPSLFDPQSLEKVQDDPLTDKDELANNEELALSFSKEEEETNSETLVKGWTF